MDVYAVLYTYKNNNIAVFYQLQPRFNSQP